jgi:hypothetical protein
MLLWTQSANTPVSRETGILNRKWETICFCLEKHSFEQKLESILRAAAGHESNSLPVGAHEYQVLFDEADSLCTQFADRWGLDVDALKAKIAGVSKLEGLATPRAVTNYARLASFGLIAIPALLFLMGALAGLVSLGFHLVGGR